MGAQGQNQNPATPVAGQGTTSTLFTSAVLTAAGAWSRSDIVTVKDAREIVLLVDATADATGGTDSVVEMAFMVSCENAQPAAGDATWFVVGDTDGIATSAALASGTLPTGTDFSATPNWWQRTYRPMVVRLAAMAADTDRIQLTIRIPVVGYRWFQMMAHEAGDTSNPATLAVSYVLAC